MPPRSAPARQTAVRSACALAITLAFAAAAARAQDDDDGPPAAPIVVNIVGDCTLTVDGREVPCRGVAYMAFPSNHRINFTAITESAGWAFSGEEDDNQDGQYALSVDSLVGPSAGRIDADGECDMELASDRRTVVSLECEADTDDGGVVTLQASGMISAGDDADENRGR